VFDSIGVRIVLFTIFHQNPAVLLDLVLLTFSQLTLGFSAKILLWVLDYLSRIKGLVWHYQYVSFIFLLTK